MVVGFAEAEELSDSAEKEAFPLVFCFRKPENPHQRDKQETAI